MAHVVGRGGGGEKEGEGALAGSYRARATRGARISSVLSPSSHFRPVPAARLVPPHSLPIPTPCRSANARATAQTLPRPPPRMAPSSCRTTSSPRRVASFFAAPPRDAHPLVQKRHYRQRAHANPFSDHALSYPAAPAQFDWDTHYPAFAGSGKTPEFADIGCGFGGLLIALAPLFPETLMLGQSLFFVCRLCRSSCHVLRPPMRSVSRCRV